MKYRVAWIYTKFVEDYIEADSVDDAKEKWEELGLDADLFFIEDEEGVQTIYD